MTLKDNIKEQRLLAVKIFIVLFMITFILLSVIAYLLMFESISTNILLLKISGLSLLISTWLTYRSYKKLKLLDDMDNNLNRICSNIELCDIKTLIILIINLSFLDKKNLDYIIKGNICNGEKNDKKETENVK